jgi:tetratricopeptide (TPR) repeat protein
VINSGRFCIGKQIENRFLVRPHENFTLRELFMSDIVKKYNQAEKLKDEGKNDEAVSLLEEILAEDPAHVLTHLTLGRIFTLQGKYEQAIAHGLKACELEPEESFNFTAMSVTYQRVFAGTQDRKYIQLAEDAMAHAHRLQGA